MNCPKEQALEEAKRVVSAQLEGKTIVKEIAVPNRIVNIVIR